MTREEFMNIVYSELHSDGDNYRANRIIDAADEYAEDNSSENTNKWIPCSDMLPEKPDNYPYCEIRRTYFLVSLASGCVKTLGYEFDRDEWQITGSPVLAWMPLPKPYKAKKEV